MQCVGECDESKKDRGALYGAVFAITESLLPEYDGYGIIRERTGNILPGLIPSNIYACQEDKWVVIGGNADGVFKRLMQAIDRQDRNC